MKYLATFDPLGISLFEWFDTEQEAQEWLNSQNNNLETRTDIDWYEDGKLIDGYIYTAG